MIKSFIRGGLLSFCCMLNLIGILLVINHWISIKSFIFSISGVFILGCLGIVSVVWLSKLSSRFDVYTIALKHLTRVSVIIFGICALSLSVKTDLLNLARGSTLYNLYYFPMVFPLFSIAILAVLDARNLQK